MPFWFLDLPVSLQFQCVSFLSASSKARCAICCRWNLILLRELRRRLPQLVAASSKTSPQQVLKQALEKMTARPNLAFVFYNNNRNYWSQAAKKLLPKDTFLLAAKSPAIQSNINKHVSAAGGVTVMLGSYPEACFAPFHLDRPAVGLQMHSAYERIKNSLDSQVPATHASGDHFWKVFIVFACGNNGAGAVEPILCNLQRDYVDAAIIGGVCDGGDVRLFGAQGSADAPTMKKYQKIVEETSPSTASPTGSAQIKFVREGIVGLALGGNVPIRAVVSRGVTRVGSTQSIVACSRSVCASGISIEHIHEVRSEQHFEN